MKYLSIDIETTGLNDDADNILSIGIIVEDTNNLLSFEDIPKLHIYVVPDRISGSLFAINMNRDIISTLAQYINLKTEVEREVFCTENEVSIMKIDDVVPAIHAFLWDNGIRYDNYLDNPCKHMRKIGDMLYPVVDLVPRTYLNVAGKNFASFDMLFLERLPKWKKAFKIRRRMFDPAQYFVDWSIDEDIPGLTLCKERAGLDPYVSHSALDDAWDVVQLMRIGTCNYKVNFNTI